ncbi:MAG: leucine-rich repeat domain-containing protein [Clostridiales bacterium]|nr:leucine-rich repeat domain-containing protein [Clostridiales bacterium]
MKIRGKYIINIAVICLCICAMTIGIYAAKQASLTATGTIGFTAHQCQVEITGTKQGYGILEGNTYTYQEQPATLTFGGEDKVTIGGTADADISKTKEIGDFQFTDMVLDYVPDIVLSFTIKNLSDFPITAAVIYNDLTGIAISTTSSEAVKITNKNDTATITLTYKLLDTNTSLTDMDLNIQILCQKFNIEQEVIDEENNFHYYLNETGTGWTVGPYTETATGNITIPQYVNNIPVTGFAEVGAIASIIDCSEFTVTTTSDDAATAWAEVKAAAAEQATFTPSDEQSYVFGSLSMGNLSEMGIIATPTTSATNKVYTIIECKTDTEQSQAFNDFLAGGREGGLSDTQIVLIFPLLLQTNLTIEETLALVGTEGVNYTSTVYSSGSSSEVEVVPVDYSFKDTEITGIEMPNTFTSIPDNYFSFNNNLTNITIPGSVKVIGDSTFKNCVNLVSVTLNDGLTSIGSSAFKDCDKLTNIVIPNSVTTIGSEAFSGSGLITITLSENLTSIAEMTFQYCYSLDNIVIPSSVISIGNDAFNRCENLTSVTLSEGVAELGERVFARCLSLESITLPSTTTTIEYIAFSDIGSLIIKCLAVVPPTINDNIAGNGMSVTTFTAIYVPADSVSAYQAADGWKNYSTKIQAL